ncbi:hypothetical protein, partial [Providencia stuartii]|uniref:hypothetical protein n=1 Tax=Providencia stuartii TaxID=588 RepID=UPI001952D042
TELARRLIREEFEARLRELDSHTRDKRRLSYKEAAAELRRELQVQLDQETDQLESLCTSKEYRAFQAEWDAARLEILAEDRA